MYFPLVQADPSFFRSIREGVSGCPGGRRIQAREESMAQKADQTGMEKMMELFLQMRQEDQNREARREQDRLDREERRVKDDRESEERREELQIQLLVQLKEAQPAVPHQVHQSAQTSLNDRER